MYIHGEHPARELSPVLVSAHYDSVSTGYSLLTLFPAGSRPTERSAVRFEAGATDDGTAIASILQIIKSFTRPKNKGGRKPKRGLIALLNNGEGDYLVGVELLMYFLNHFCWLLSRNQNGARAFAAHPISKLPRKRFYLLG